MKLQDQEIRIKEKIKANRNDETIYLDLQKIILMFLRRKKVCNCWKDYDDLSHQMAADIFMKIIAGYEIDKILGYLEKVYRSYAQTYYKENSYETVIFDDTSLGQVIIYGEPSYYKYRYIDNKIYLQEISRVINDVMRSCKYKQGTPAFINIKLSLVISILRREKFYFHLNKEQEFYLSMLINKFYGKIVNEGLDLNEKDY